MEARWKSADEWTPEGKPMADLAVGFDGVHPLQCRRMDAFTGYACMAEYGKRRLVP